jgi:hypothetical protein
LAGLKAALTVVVVAVIFVLVLQSLVFERIYTERPFYSQANPVS